ncbi:MAG: hypothetical protein IJ457_05240 [Clostridia bacterium]|nr:hypothetical protein [Clostridia bacterium]
MYYLDDNDYTTLEYYADQNDVPNDVWENLLEFMSGHYYYYNENGSLCEGYKWKGSCYGMCVTTLLDKYGQIDVNNRTINTSNLNDINIQKSSPTLESMINYYQLLYHTCGVPYDTLNSIMWYLREALRFNELCVINYHGSDPDNLEDDLYHAIIAYDIIEYGTTGQVFDIKVYDPISPTSNGYIRVVLEDSLLATVRSCVYYNSPLSTHPTQIIDRLGFCDHDLLADFFKAYDLDGPYNTGVSNLLATNESDDLGTNISEGLIYLNELVQDDKVTIYVSGGDDFSIINKEGLSVDYNEETDSLSGSMNLYRVAKTQSGYANAPFTYVITTDFSDSFDLVTNSSNICDFYVLKKESFSGVTAKDFASVTISNCNSVKIFGDNNIKSAIAYGNVQMVHDTINMLDK